MTTQESQPGAKGVGWSDLGLDPRLLRSLGKQGFASPTPVQGAAIPKALEGKDIVARARTGSGKTLAYLLPALHRVLSSGDTKSGWRALVLVPTRELCEQVAGEARAVVAHCGAPLAVSALVADAPAMARAAAAGAGAVVVATPARVAAALREGWLPQGALQQRLQVLVLDEADLLLSYGYEDDIRLLAPQVPRSCQCMLMSATTSSDVEALTKLVLHNPTTLNLLAPPGGAANGGGADGGGADGGGGGGGLAEGGSGAAAEIRHWHYPCAKEDRALVLLALLKLGLLRKKVLVFANSSDEGMRLRLFLEAFGVRLALLSPDQPLNSRSHILASFNKGLFDYLIAIDDVHAATAGAPPPKKQRKRQQAAAAAAAAKGAGGRGRGPAKDEEFGVTRGIDFKGVRTIVNYDLPATVAGYVHRVGRTGRAGQSGAALTLLTPPDLPPPLAAAAAARGLAKRAPAAAAASDCFGAQLLAALDSEARARAAPEAAAGGGGDEEDSGSDGEGEGGGGEAGPLPLFPRLTSAAVEGLRYRGEDVLRGISRAAVKEARAREVAQQLLNSERLKDYFQSHEAEQARRGGEQRPFKLQSFVGSLLRHDKPIHRKQLDALSHLKHVPAYLKDPSLAGGASATGGGAAAAAAAAQQQQQRQKRPRKEDPLKAIGFAPVGKKSRAHGGARTEDLTELEKAAMAKPAKDPRARERKMRERLAAAGAAGGGNVRKGAKKAKQSKRRR
ncbi:DEAD-box ATP-dependent RNA helicase [Raphidocelis subcapitata]|uniref:RNA helicase n=1 Tax=Raphidocelis subcapitata TaxID=307507 RepID=A0A2V0NNZ1_9CHLO|nr:DEAD-box ATP-dependent RNA helicase [Raphidocelis subcapitata]|eukprot:GBF89331.1 DEAD-box ATP-dependent RNA helicase [Raphidocelis subcapitata]